MVIGSTLLNVLQLESVEFQFIYVGRDIDFVQCAKPKKLQYAGHSLHAHYIFNTQDNPHLWIVLKTRLHSGGGTNLCLTLSEAHIFD